MVTNSLSVRLGAGPGRSKVSWIIGDPFMTSSTMVKMVVRTVAFSSICCALLVWVVYTLKRTTVLFPCQQLAQSVGEICNRTQVSAVDARTCRCTCRTEDTRCGHMKGDSQSLSTPLDPING